MIRRIHFCLECVRRTLGVIVHSKRFWQGLGLFFVALTIGIILTLEVFSRGAAAIFNQAVQNQDMLSGTITVDKLLAHINGKVTFENLEWKDPDGNTILLVPSGSFRVRPYDVITGNMKSTTIQELTLRNAVVSIHLSDDMQVDFVRPTPDMNKMKEHDPDDDDWRNKVGWAGLTEEQRKEVGEWKRAHRAQKMEKNWANFNRKGRKVRMELNLKDCQLEVFFRHRHYMMDHVNLTTDVNTSEKMTIHASTGGFGGTMIGNGVRLDGDVDFTTQPVPTGDFILKLLDVDPSSLGFGLNIHDKMSMYTHLKGPVNNFTGEGSLKLNTLHIPALQFENVTGDLYYDGAGLTFQNVKANVYGGYLEARGDYDLDTRAYHLFGTGTGLQASQGLPGSHLSCKVNMNIAIDSRGSSKETNISGSFESGEGKYQWLPFKKLSGSFSNDYHDLKFSDVTIELAGFTIKTDGLRIKDNVLSLEPIKILDPKTGQLFSTVTQNDIDNVRNGGDN